MMREDSTTVGDAPHHLMNAVWPVLAALAGLAFWRVAQFPTLWVFLTVLGLLIPLLALFSGSWTRFFLAFMIFGISLNLDKTFNHAGNIGGVGGFAVSLVDLALMCLLVPAAINAALTHSLRVRLHWSTTVPALVLMQIMALSIAGSRTVDLSFFQLLETGKLFVLYLFVANTVRSEEDVDFMISCLLAGVLFQGVVVVLQGADLFPEELQTSLGFKGALVSQSGSGDVEIFRPSGTIGHANILGAFLTASLPVSIGQLLRPTGSREKLLPFAALGIGMTALIMSFSRGAWIGFAMAVTWVLTVAIIKGQLGRKQLLWIGLGIFMIGVIVVTFSNLVESRIFDPDPGSAKDRMRLNELAWRVIEDNPLLGVGLNTFGTVMLEYDTMHFGPQNVVHNVYLLLSAECGVFALLAFLWFMLAVARQAVKAMHSPSVYLSMTATAILGGLVGLWLQMNVEIINTGPPVQVFWFFAGLLAGINGLREPDSHRNRVSRHARIGNSHGSLGANRDHETPLVPL
jgi:O-antigen ligase